jgi:hypothetical protein
MRKKSLIYLLVFTFIFAGVSQVQAQMVVQPRQGNTGSWRVLGTVQANHNADHDVIYVKGPYDFFRRIKFKVTDSPLNMMRMVVRYDDGGLPENIETRMDIPKGGESRIIDLNGGKRKLKSIEFWYDTKGIFNGKADVTLLGIK